MNHDNIRLAALYLSKRGHLVSIPSSTRDYPKLRGQLIRARGLSSKEVRIASLIVRKTYGRDHIRTASSDNIKASVGAALVQNELDKQSPPSTEAQSGFNFLLGSLGAKSPQKYIALVQKAVKEPLSDSPYSKLLGRKLKGLAYNEAAELVGQYAAALKSQNNQKLADLLGVEAKTLLIVNQVIAQGNKTASVKTAVATSWWATPILDGIGWAWTHIIEFIGANGWGVLKWLFGTNAMKWVGSAIVDLMAKLIPDAISEAYETVSEKVTEGVMGWLTNKLKFATNFVAGGIWNFISEIPSLLYQGFKGLCKIIYEYVPHNYLLIGIGAALLLWYLVTYLIQTGAKVAALPPKMFLILPLKGVWWVMKQVFSKATKLTGNATSYLLNKLGIRNDKDKIDELVDFSMVNSKYTTEAQTMLESILENP